jgi:hybrid cluster-associated redox disulfide protein
MRVASPHSIAGLLPYGSPVSLCRAKVVPAQRPGAQDSPVWVNPMLNLEGASMPSADFDNPDLMLKVLFDRWPATASVFLSHRMLCFGCPVAPFHTILDACREYHMDEAKFRLELATALL